MHLSFLTLICLISFAAVNAVLFTPALPEISKFFDITSQEASLTVTCFLVGYTLCQLVYGPLANRFGRKPTLILGVSIQIVSSIICAVSAYFHSFGLLVFGRFLLAVGSGVGLKMTFTMVSESYKPKMASKKTSYLMIAFATMPGISVGLGGILNEHFHWSSCFWAGALYGLLILKMVFNLPETAKRLDPNALRISYLKKAYIQELHHINLIAGALLIGCTSSFIYIFATIGPFITSHYFGMSSSVYGLYNLLAQTGLILGSLLGPCMIERFLFWNTIRLGLLIVWVGVIILCLLNYLQLTALYSIFLPLIIIHFGLCLMMPSIASFVMAGTTNKANGSSLMSFINLSLATIFVLSVKQFTIDLWLLPKLQFLLCLIIYFLLKVLLAKNTQRP